MAAALVAPVLVTAWYREGKVRSLAITLLAVVLVVGLGLGVIQAMVSTDEFGNSVKLSHLHDYGVLFSDWRNLVFGQGLGAAFFSTAWGTRATLTEVTYLEILRNYGLLFAPLLYGLILYPLHLLRDQRARPDHYLLLGYACYLGICIADPLLLSSSGMLVLAIVLYRMFCGSARVAWLVNSEKTSPALLGGSVA